MLVPVCVTRVEGLRITGHRHTPAAVLELCPETMLAAGLVAGQQVEVVHHHSGVRLQVACVQGERGACALSDPASDGWHLGDAVTVLVWGARSVDAPARMPDTVQV